MASADVTVYDTGTEVEADTNQRTATIWSPGSDHWLYLTAAGDALVSFVGATIDTTQATQDGVVRLKANVPVKVPGGCSSFTFKAPAQTFFQFVKNRR